MSNETKKDIPEVDININEENEEVLEAIIA